MQQETELVNTASAAEGSGVTVERIAYHGWSDCYRIGNGLVEAIVVPAIGRVMHFGLAGDAAGTFWENRALDGQLHETADNEWMNLGGDKSWPAPQSSWPLHQGRAWPPPEAFDAQPLQVEVTARGVVLIAEADVGFGIAVVRHVELEQGQPSMRIRTEFHKVAGDPARVSVWTITQMRDPERVALLVPERPSFTEGFARLLATEPQGLRRSGSLLSMARHRQEYVKIGVETPSLVWVGKHCVVRIDAENGPGEYPDGGCIGEVYTNPDPLPYVELETLGPLAELQAGQSTARTTVYTVWPRTTEDVEAEARQALCS